MRIGREASLECNYYWLRRIRPFDEAPRNYGDPFYIIAAEVVSSLTVGRIGDKSAAYGGRRKDCPAAVLHPPPEAMPG